MSLKDSPLQTAEEINLALRIQHGVHLPNLIQTQEDCALRAGNPIQTVHTLEKQMRDKIILCMYTSSSTPEGLPS